MEWILVAFIVSFENNEIITERFEHQYECRRVGTYLKQISEYKSKRTKFKCFEVNTLNRDGIRGD